MKTPPSVKFKISLQTHFHILILKYITIVTLIFVTCGSCGTLPDFALLYLVHDLFFEVSDFVWRERVGLANDGDDVDFVV